MSPTHDALGFVALRWPPLLAAAARHKSRSTQLRTQNLSPFISDIRSIYQTLATLVTHECPVTTDRRIALCLSFKVSSRWTTNETLDKVYLHEQQSSSNQCKNNCDTTSMSAFNAISIGIDTSLPSSHSTSMLPRFTSRWWDLLTSGGIMALYIMALVNLNGIIQFGLASQVAVIKQTRTKAFRARHKFVVCCLFVWAKQTNEIKVELVLDLEQR